MATPNTRTDTSAAPVPLPVEEDSDVVSLASDTSMPQTKDRQELAWKIATRGRGRAPTTGDYEVLQQYKSLRAKVAIMQELEGVNDPELQPQRTRSLARIEKDVAGEMEAIRQAPTLDLVARVLEETNRIIKVADKSGHLQGGFVRILKEAAVLIRSAVTTVSTRSTQGTRLEHEVEAEKLRVTLHQTRRDKELLEETVRNLQEELQRRPAEEKVVPPPVLEGSPILRARPKTTRRKGQARILSSSSSEMQEERHDAASPDRLRRKPMPASPRGKGHGSPAKNIHPSDTTCYGRFSSEP